MMKGLTRLEMHDVGYGQDGAKSRINATSSSQSVFRVPVRHKGLRQSHEPHDEATMML